MPITQQGCTALVLNTSQPAMAMGVWQPATGWVCQHTALPNTAALFTALAALASQQHAPPAQWLTDVIVTTGPGSYTGLRAGISMVQAMAMANPALQVWPVSQFQIRLPQGHSGWVMLPALRHMVFVGHIDNNHTLTTSTCVDSTQWQPPAQPTQPTQPTHQTLWHDDATLPSLTDRTYPCHPLPKHNPLEQTLALWQGGHLKPQPWAQVQPLYLRPPHITLPKTTVL
jgi:tRNA A37 threonylcarbamoyladenosine modification protein TsaB